MGFQEKAFVGGRQHTKTQKPAPDTSSAPWLRSLVDKILAESKTPEVLWDRHTHCLERSHFLGEELEARGVSVSRIQVRNHVFLLVGSGPNETIIDPTYTQFLQGWLATDARVFVGTREELVALHARTRPFTEAALRVRTLYGFREGDTARRVLSRQRTTELMRTP